MPDSNQNTLVSKTQEEYWNCLSFRLSRGKYTLIDIDDFEAISKRKWQAMPNRPGIFYAYTSQWLGGKRKTCKMHRFILQAKSGEMVDHINRDTLDNRRCNLRVVTLWQNARNRSPNKNCLSEFKGVYASGRLGKPWQSSIEVNKKKIHIGLFKSEIEAATAYNKAARLHHGEYAYQNIIFGDGEHP